MQSRTVPIQNSLYIVINNNKLVHLTLWITALQHFHCSLAEINSIVEKFVNSSIT